MPTPTAIDLLAPVHRLSVARYLQMAEAGLLDGDVRVELIDGVVVEMSPQGTPHYRALGWLNKVLVPQLPSHLMLIPQSTLPLPALDSAPEPDIYVLDETLVGDADAVPLLALEVAVTSLAYDRITKGRLYARLGVADYWIVNVAEGAVEVHRAPRDGVWTDRTVHGPDAVLEPLLLPGVKVGVGELLAFTAG